LQNCYVQKIIKTELFVDSLRNGVRKCSRVQNIFVLFSMLILMLITENFMKFVQRLLNFVHIVKMS